MILASCTSDGASQASDDVETQSSVAVAEEVSEDPTEAIPASNPPDVAPSIEPVSDTTTTEQPVETDDLDELNGLDTTPCIAPATQEFYVDVPPDDPDGGLNIRVAPGVPNDIVGVSPRSSALVTTGACATLGSVDWWKVETVDDGIDGWVSSRFLSEFTVFNPGVGKAIDDPASVGASAETLEALAALIAESYGFDDDRVITMTSDEPAIDAQGGAATFEMTGLKDDASNGFIVEIIFVFDKNEGDGGEIESFTATKVTNYALCSRGVTDTGLCS